MNVPLLVSVAVVYIVGRLAEAYGLWNDRAWAEWLAALSGGLYVPFEFEHLMHRPSAISVGVLAANVCVIGFLALQLWRRRNNDVPRQ